MRNYQKRKAEESGLVCCVACKYDKAAAKAEALAEAKGKITTKASGKKPGNQTYFPVAKIDEHYRTDHSERKYRCPLCTGCYFIKLGHLLLHLKRKHPNGENLLEAYMAIFQQVEGDRRAIRALKRAIDF